MITGMSPPSMVGLMMGIWYFAIAIGNAIAGVVSQWTIVDSNIPVITASSYANIFGWLGIISIVAGVLAISMVPRLKNMLTR